MIVGREARSHRGGLLIEMILALAIFVAAATAILATTRSGVREIKRTLDVQVATDHAASALASLQASLASVQELDGPVPVWTGDDGPESFADAMPESSGWVLELVSERSEFPGLLTLTVNVSRDPARGAGGLARGGLGMEMGRPTPIASLTALVPLDRADPPDENPDDALEAMFSGEAFQ